LLPVDGGGGIPPSGLSPSMARHSMDMSRTGRVESTSGLGHHDGCLRWVNIPAAYKA
jgi:hypothetical protein